MAASAWSQQWHVVLVNEMGTTEAYYDTEKEARKGIKQMKKNSVRTIEQIVLSKILVNTTDASEIALFKTVVYSVSMS